MARIVEATDNHASGVKDRNAGHPHTRRPLIGVTVYIGLEPAEAQLIKDQLKQRKRLSTLIAKGWQYSSFAEVLKVSYKIDNNPWNITDTTELARKALSVAQNALRRLAQAS